MAERRGDDQTLRHLVQPVVVPSRPSEATSVMGVKDVQAYPAWAQSTLYDQTALDAVYRVAFRFVLMSLVYLAIGVSLGGLIFVGVRIPIFIHVHLNLYGFLLMFVFGMAYKLVPPMFARRQGLFSLRLARLQFWLANGGLLGLVGASLLDGQATALGITAMVMAVGAVWIFVLNMGLTLYGASREVPHG